MATQSSKNNTGMKYAAERMQHLLVSSADSIALQFIFAAEIQAQATMALERRNTPADAAPADAADAAPVATTPPQAAPAAPAAEAQPLRPPRPGMTPKKVTTTQTWRLDETATAEPARMPAELPEEWGWDEVQWVDFQESAEGIATGEMASQLFQLVYEQAKRLVDSVTDEGRQTPDRPIDEALVGALADSMREIVPAAGLQKRALALLKALDAESPLYGEKADAVCAGLFMENPAELPQGVSPEAVQLFLRLVLAVARRRYRFLAPDGMLSTEKMARIEKEKAYKRYLLQDVRERVLAVLCPMAAEEADEEENADPDFTYDEQQLLEQFRQLVRELLDAAMLSARQDAKAVLKKVKAIDARIGSAAEKWALMRLDRLDRCLLRLGTYQLVYAEEKRPAALVINSAVEAAKLFGEQKSPAFVNGVLDRIRKDAIGEPVTFG